MLTNLTLQNAFLKTFNSAVQNYDDYDEIFANFFSAQGYSGLSIDDVTAAETQLYAYQLYYWQGTYSTTNIGTGQSGPSFIIGLDNNSLVQVSYGGVYIIQPTFANLVLQWDTTNGLNATDGSLTFSATPETDGTNTFAFAGTIGSADIAGAFVPPANADAGSSPTTSSGDALSVALTIVDDVNDVLNLLVSVTTLYLNIKMLRSGFLSNPQQVAVAAQSTLENAEVSSQQLGKSGDRGAIELTEKQVSTTTNEKTVPLPALADNTSTNIGKAEADLKSGSSDDPDNAQNNRENDNDQNNDDREVSGEDERTLARRSPIEIG